MSASGACLRKYGDTMSGPTAIFFFFKHKEFYRETQGRNPSTTSDNATSRHKAQSRGARKRAGEKRRNGEESYGALQEFLRDDRNAYWMNMECICDHMGCLLVAQGIT